MKRFFLLSSLSIFAVLAAIPAVSDAQSVYRWVDANGRVQYSDQPPPSDAKNVQQKNVGGNSIQNNELSVAAADAQKKNPVTIYVSECGEACDAARNYLNKRGIPHTVIDPSRSLELNNKFKADTGGGTIVPVLKVGEKRLTGWSESGWASALDSAGYPKTGGFAKPKPVEDRSGLLDAPKSPTKPPSAVPTQAPKSGARPASAQPYVPPGPRED
jgi:glutaredoxin